MKKVNRLKISIIDGRHQLIIKTKEELLNEGVNISYEKMSKSKGNSVSVDEALGVQDLSQNYEFVTLPPEYIYVDYKKIPIYKNSDGYYYIINTYGHLPVLLIDKTQEYIPRFDINGMIKVQHEDKIDPKYIED